MRPTILLEPVTLTSLFVMFLSSVLLLGVSTEPPTVDVSTLRHLDDGCAVTVRGVIVDIRAFDSGADMVVLLDLQGPETARVHISAGSRPRVSTYASVGDQLAVTGRLASESQIPVVYSVSDRVTLTAYSADSLSISMVCENWQLFIYDEFTVKGYIGRDAGSDAFKIFDDQAGRPPGLRVRYTDALPILEGEKVAVSGRLAMDLEDMSLELAVRSISVAV